MDQNYVFLIFNQKSLVILLSKNPTILQPERLNNMLKKERYLKKEALSTVILFQISAEFKTESERCQGLSS